MASFNRNRFEDEHEDEDEDEHEDEDEDEHEDDKHICPGALRALGARASRDATRR